MLNFIKAFNQHLKALDNQKRKSFKLCLLQKWEGPRAPLNEFEWDNNRIDKELQW